MTHGAISKQIATLEAWFDRPLFEKNRKRMIALEPATTLASAMAEALQLMRAAVDAVEERSEAVVLRVLAPSTFAMRWLIPRVWSFSERHPDIEIQVRQTDSLESWLEIPFDVAIRSGAEAPGHLTPVPFLRDKLILALAPHRLEQAGQQPGAFGGPVLQAATRPGELDAWFKVAGLAPPARTVGFPHFYLALEAALAGQGALVCPLETIGDLLRKGELVEPWPQVRAKGPSYAAIFDARSRHARHAETFVGWLKEAGERPAAAARRERA